MGTADVIPVEIPDGLANIIARYGDPKLKASPNGWTVDPKWESDNMIMIYHGILPTGRLYVHKLAAPIFLKVFDRWSDRIKNGDPFKLTSIGCFSPRAQRGSTLIASTHSWGIAIDVCPDQNPMISPCAPDDPRRKTNKTIPDDWIYIAESEGLVWGGSFSHKFDPMHFQLCSGY